MKSAGQLDRKMNMFAEAKGFLIVPALVAVLCCLIYVNGQLSLSHLFLTPLIKLTALR